MALAAETKNAKYWYLNTIAMYFSIYYGLITLHYGFLPSDDSVPRLLPFCDIAINMWLSRLSQKVRVSVGCLHRGVL